MQPSLLIPQIDNNIFSFIASAAYVKVHYHHCLQIVVSLDNPYDCVIDGHDVRNNRGFLINQTVRHACNAPQSQVLVLKINAAGMLGKQLKAYLNGKSYIELRDILPEDYFSTIFPADYISLPSETLQQGVNNFIDRILQNCGQSYIPRVNYDERIQAALQFINERIDESITVKDIAKIMHLSPDRSRHLFMEQLGSPFLQYVLWLRVRKILADVRYKNMNLATACVQYGFTDQSHFNKIFNRLYGVPATAMLKSSRFI